MATPITFTYDLVNRPLTVTDGSGIFTYQYDTAGRQKKTTRPDGKVINYSYDADSNTAAITYPDGYVYTYTYDELDRMTDVSETPSGSTTLKNLAHYAYDPLSRRTSLAYGNGTSTTYGYDAYSGLTSIAHAFVGTPPGVTITTTRDANERRASDTFSPGTAYVWHPPAAATTTYQPNALNQYTSINGQTLGYGGAGNLASDPTAPLGSATYQWDLKNRLTSAGNPQHQASYGYDAFSRRSARTMDGVTTMFVSDGSREIADYDSAGHELVRFVYGLDNAPIVEEPVDANGAATDTWYHHLDAIGTTIALTDHTGALYKAYATSPWGEVGGIQGTPFRFAGMRLDAETKLYYDNARYYSPQMGRFLSPDPIGTEGGINLYAYVGNDSVNFIDPSGTDITVEGRLFPRPWWLEWFDRAFETGEREPTFHESNGGGGSETIVVTADKNKKPKTTPPPSPQPPSRSQINPPKNELGNGPESKQKPSCNSVLPNGQTIEQVVRNSISNIEGATGPYDSSGFGVLGAFVATVESNGPIDFKNNFRGAGSSAFFGAAGNFAYGAIASGIGYPQFVAELGAGAYAVSAGKATPGNPFLEDPSAASNLPSGYRSGGCTR